MTERRIENEKCKRKKLEARYFHLRDHRDQRAHKGKETPETLPETLL